MNKKGFTLIELLAVIAILGLLVTIAIVSVSKNREKINQKEKEILTSTIVGAFQNYRVKNSTNDETQISFTNLKFTNNLNYNNIECKDTTGSSIKYVRRGKIENTNSLEEMYCIKLVCNGKTIINDYETNEYCGIDNGITEEGSEDTNFDETKLVSKILGKNNSNVVTTENGLYKSTATNSGKPTYYYKGNVENNYVKMGVQTYITNTYAYCGLKDEYKEIYGDIGFGGYDETDCINPPSYYYICDETEYGGGYSITDWCMYYNENGDLFEGNTIPLTGKTKWYPAGTKTVTEDLFWRIVRINEDGTIRMILDQSIIDDSWEYPEDVELAKKLRWHVFNKNNSVYYSESNVNGGIKKDIDNWYAANLTQYDHYIATTNFCEANKISNISSYTADFKCPKDKNNKQYVNSKIGLITVDEILKSGNSFDGYNNSFLNSAELHGGYPYWWTMSPTSSGVYTWYNSGDISVQTADILFHGGGEGNSIRPVINLNNNITATGAGTKNNPWVVQTN